MASINDYNPGDPMWWVITLHARLRARIKRIKIYGDYYDGKHNLQFSSSKFVGAFGEMLKGLRDNWCPIVVDATSERCKVDGFRWGDDQKSDKDAWRIWQENHLDAESQIGHTEALINEESYALVSPFADSQTIPQITIEHPTQMIVAYSEESRWRRRAALKVWETEFGDTFANLYLPDAIYKYQATQSSSSQIIIPASVSVPGWKQREDEGDGEWPLKNPLNLVPVVPISNRPRLLKAAVSEIDNVIPNQDAANKFLADMVVASEHQGWRQRYAMGLKLEYDEEGNPIQPWDSAVDRLWTSENKDVKMGEFSATDFTQHIKAMESRVQSIASQSRTPPHYFYLSGQFPSGESIKSAETGLVAKSHDKQVIWGEAWEETERIALLAMGNAKGKDNSAETIWRDAESRTESEMVDAAVKLKAIGIADEILWERVGMTQKQITRNRILIAQQALLLNAALRTGSPELPIPIPATAGAA